MATIDTKNIQVNAAVGIAPSSQSGKKEAFLGVSVPSTNAPSGAIQIEPQGIYATARFFLLGKPGENVFGWRFGFIQLMVASDDWALYRGATRTDGSTLIASDRPPVRREDALCRDSSPGQPTMWYAPERTMGAGANDPDHPITKILPEDATIPSDGKLEVFVNFSDAPRSGRKLIEENKLFTPPRKNWLHKVKRDLYFTTILAAQYTPKGKPPLKVQILGHFDWSSSVNLELVWTGNGNRHNIEFKHSIYPVIETPFKPGESDQPVFKKRALDTSLEVCTTLVSKSWADMASYQYFKDWVVGNLDLDIDDAAVTRKSTNIP